MNLSGRKIFLSGPMTGIKHYNIAAFAEAHAALRERGADLIYDPALTWLMTPPESAEHMSHADWMRVCAHELTSGQYDLLVQLPGWEDSEGAMTEFDVALACGIEACSLSDLTGEPEVDGGLRRRASIEVVVKQLVTGVLTPSEGVETLARYADA